MWILKVKNYAITNSHKCRHNFDIIYSYFLYKKFSYFKHELEEINQNCVND